MHTPNEVNLLSLKILLKVCDKPQHFLSSNPVKPGKHACNLSLASRITCWRFLWDIIQHFYDHIVLFDLFSARKRRKRNLSRNIFQELAIAKTRHL
jgi:hypothetical protein